jgi:hypothetical protein
LSRVGIAAALVGVALLERFPVGVNRDSQWGRKRQVLVGNSAFGAVAISLLT